jgi:AbrB family looped-hinge helix DNA binding protein
MSTKVTIDKAGRLVLPKPLRDELRLAPGDILELTREGDKIIISAAHPQLTLQKEHGVWVYRSGQPADASLPELIDKDREDRFRRSGATIPTMEPVCGGSPKRRGEAPPVGRIRSPRSTLC